MSPNSEAAIKAFNLHLALTRLLDAYKDVLKETDREPLFGKDEGVVDAERALFENRPAADWEVSDRSTSGGD